ncbi:hypothetical protein CYMTET_28820 [Cymbomonas tetramitiformis]|uniref:DNA-directed RNA polymerase n=1 Tax=Cymbomonas tetramitiformis TaxID=36881 RepID=A0AAE0FM13_9CHLO|nr:hypothetical protein CYMTET_28820 [Cymbomonas tetramitiformis]
MIRSSGSLRKSLVFLYNNRRIVQWGVELRAPSALSTNTDVLAAKWTGRHFSTDNQDLAKLPAVLQNLGITLHATVERKRREEQRNILEKQIELEYMAVETGVERYHRMARETASRDSGSTLPAAKQLIRKWYEPLALAFKHEQDLVKKGVTATDRRVYGPYLLLLPPEKLAVITLHTVVSALMKGEKEEEVPVFGRLKTVKLVSWLGEIVQAQSSSEVLEKQARLKTPDDSGPVDEQAEKAAKQKLRRQNIVADRLQNITDVRKVKDKARKLLKKVKMHTSPWRKAAVLLVDDDWGLELRQKVGAAVLNIFMTVATVRSEGADVSALVHSYRFKDQPKTASRYGVVEWHPEAAKLLEDAHKDRAVEHPRYMPMLVPPRPWRRYNDGGHLTISSVVMRGAYSRAGPSPAQIAELKKYERGSPDSFQQVYDALNVLGSQRWSINRPVFDVMSALWEKGDRGAAVENEPGMHYPGTMQRDSKRKIRAAGQYNAELHSQRCDFEYKLSVGRLLRDEVFHYPHNIDFRGRAYTMHPHLNHLGADPSRASLQFADPHPLGEHGLYWLFLHLANKYANGVDKYSLPARRDWAEENLAEVLDSAERPMDGRMWWTQAEDPFQCLATCFDIRDALRAPRVEEYRSRLPVHQDGSCNGLQHYAALGRDELGGQARRPVQRRPVQRRPVQRRPVQRRPVQRRPPA